MQDENKILARTDGYITVDMPPIKIPTPSTAARRLVTSPAVRYLILVLIGMYLGNGFQGCESISNLLPTPVIPSVETLDEFVARESQALSADERQKLIAVAEKVLLGFYDHPYEIRESFREERMKAGLDSETFKTFSAKWSAKVTEMKIEENVDSVKSVYESLLHGLQTVKSYIDLSSDFSGEPAEGFFDDVSPSNVTSNDKEDVPVLPEIQAEPPQAIETKPPVIVKTAQQPQRPRFFRRR